MKFFADDIKGIEMPPERIIVRRDCCGIPIAYKRRLWRERHEPWVATLSAAERELWLMQAPEQWPS